MSARLAAHVSSIEDCDAVAAAGAEHVIIEQSLVAVRCFMNHDDDESFELIDQISQYIRTKQPHLSFSVTIDKLYHDRHADTIITCLKRCAQCQVPTLRIQDLGLAVLAHEHHPQAQLILNSETGFANAAALRCAFEHPDFPIHGVVLSNDWEHPAITKVRSQCKEFLSIQAHGPILLQYSDRRQLSGLHAHHHELEGDPDTLPALPLTPVSVEKRPYTMLDNKHGAFLYAGFDRCLLQHVDKLLELKLDEWIIDGRGRDQTYRDNALRAYQRAREQASENTYVCDTVTLDALKVTAPHPFKPGFFLTNNTDYVFEDHAQQHRERRTLARIQHVRKPHGAIVLLVDHWQRGQAAYFEDQKGERHELILDDIRDLHGKALTDAGPGDMVSIPWRKRMAMDGYIYFAD